MVPLGTTARAAALPPLFLKLLSHLGVENCGIKGQSPAVHSSLPSPQTAKDWAPLWATGLIPLELDSDPS